MARGSKNKSGSKMENGSEKDKQMQSPSETQSLLNILTRPQRDRKKKSFDGFQTHSSDTSSFVTSTPMPKSRKEVKGKSFVTSTPLSLTRRLQMSIGDDTSAGSTNVSRCEDSSVTDMPSRIACEKIVDVPGERRASFSCSVISKDNRNESKNDSMPQAMLNKRRIGRSRKSGLELKVESSEDVNDDPLSPNTARKLVTLSSIITNKRSSGRAVLKRNVVGASLVGDPQCGDALDGDINTLQLQDDQIKIETPETGGRRGRPLRDSVGKEKKIAGVKDVPKKIEIASPEGPVTPKMRNLKSSTPGRKASAQPPLSSHPEATKETGRRSLRQSMAHSETQNSAQTESSPTKTEVSVAENSTASKRRKSRRPDSDVHSNDHQTPNVIESVDEDWSVSKICSEEVTQATSLSVASVRRNRRLSSKTTNKVEAASVDTPEVPTAPGAQSNQENTFKSCDGSLNTLPVRKPHCRLEKQKPDLSSVVGVQFIPVLTNSIANGVRVKTPAAKEQPVSRARSSRRSTAAVNQAEADDNSDDQGAVTKKSDVKEEAVNEEDNEETEVEGGSEELVGAKEVAPKRRGRPSKGTPIEKKVAVANKPVKTKELDEEDKGETKVHKRRGRKPKCSSKEEDVSKNESVNKEEDDDNESASEEIQETTPPKKKGRPPRGATVQKEVNDKNEGKGRPKRQGKRKVYISDDDEEEGESESDFEQPSTKKRKGGAVKKTKAADNEGKPKRQRKRKIITSDEEDSESEDETPSSKNKKKRKGVSGNKTKTEPRVRICGLCKIQFDDLYQIKRHFLTTHSRLYSAKEPEGVEHSAHVIRLLGYIDCQQCQKRFRFVGYYNHHRKWCGRENEIARCEICTHEVKAMWLQQHIAAHKLADKRKEEKKEKAKEDKLRRQKEKEEEEREAKDLEGTPLKSKRKAARSALKTMSTVADGGDDKGSDNEGNDGDRSDESVDDDNETDEEDDLDTDGDDKSNKPSKMQGRLSKWSHLFTQTVNEPVTSELKKVRKFYSNFPTHPIFIDLRPLKADWQPVNPSKRSWYMSQYEQEVYFTSNIKCEETTDGNIEEGQFENTLTFGQTVPVKDKAYCCTGGAVWAIEWCPLPEGGCCGKQVLALAVDAGKDWLDCNAASSGPGILQLWEMKSGGSEGSDKGKTDEVPHSPPELCLKMCIAHDGGKVRSMSWCPRRVFDLEDNKVACGDGEAMRRLGLLAVACSSGDVLVYSVPQLDDIQSVERSQCCSDDKFSTVPLVKPEPTLKLRLNAHAESLGPCLCVAWQTGGESQYVVAGYGRGTLVLWDLSIQSPLLRAGNSLKPIRMFHSHDAPVVSLAWSPQFPHLLTSSSLDFQVLHVDITRPGTVVPVDERKVHPSYGRTLRWAGPLYLGILCAEESLATSLGCGISYIGLCRGLLYKKRMFSYVISNNLAATWDMDFCTWSHVAVCCDANGNVKVFLPDLQGITKEKYRKVPTEARSMMMAPAATLYKVGVAQSKNTSSKANQESLVVGATNSNIDEPQSTQSSTTDKGPTGKQSKDKTTTGAMNNKSYNQINSYLPPNPTKTAISPNKDKRTNVTTNCEAGSSVDHEAGAVVDECGDYKPDVGTADMEEVNSEQQGGNVYSFDDPDTLDFKITFSPPEDQLEDPSNLNSRIINKVRLNPNRDYCMWLASGGQAGLLRVEDISRVDDQNQGMLKNIKTKTTQAS